MKAWLKLAMLHHIQAFDLKSNLDTHKETICCWIASLNMSDE